MKNKLKIVLAQLNPVVGDVKGNAQKLINIRSNLNNNIDIIVVPELYISGYPFEHKTIQILFFECHSIFCFSRFSSQQEIIRFNKSLFSLGRIT